MTGIELITQERREQLEKHGRTIELDYKINQFYELANMAAILTFNDSQEVDEDGALDIADAFINSWNPDIVERLIRKPYKERLIIAGALIAAELDRLEFKKQQEK